MCKIENYKMKHRRDIMRKEKTNAKFLKRMKVTKHEE